MPPDEDAAGDLKGRVPYQESAENPTQLGIVHAEFFADLYPGNGYIGAVDKCHGAHNQKPGYEQISNGQSTLPRIGVMGGCFP
jgi:ABC-type sugar transport system substrate-binding protein